MSRYIRRLERQNSAIRKIQTTIQTRMDDAANRGQESKAAGEEYLAAVSECFDIVKAAYEDKSENLDEILEKAEAILSDAVTFAYTGDGVNTYTQVFPQFPSFAHDEGVRPLLKWPSLPEGCRSYQDIEMLVGMARLLGGQQGKLFKAQFNPPLKWKETPHPHPLSSPCARFVEGITAATFAGSPTRAMAVLQARFELTTDMIAVPGNVSVSKDGNGFVLEMHGGWKEREHFFKYYSFVDKDRDGSLTTRLEGLSHSCFDHERFLIAGGDDDRMKVWTMAPADYKGRDDTIPLHTMDTEEFSGPITFLPNNRIARAGKGQLAIWDLGLSPTHGSSGKDIIGEELDPECFDWGWEDGEVECSSGTPPHAKQDLPWKESGIGTWHPHPSNPVVMLCATERMKSDSYYCHAVDLEQGGKVSARYLGIGGDIVGFTTSQGNHNLFTVASTDGYVRIYDHRSAMPALTFQVTPEGDEDYHPSAVLCHPAGVPLLYTSASTEQSIKLWDLRGNVPVYELATGNNHVEAMVWNDHDDELFAVTRNPNKNRMGSHYREDYRRARIPRSQLYGEDTDEIEEDRYAHEFSWPKKAFHAENYWGYVFDEGDHVIFRYVFKENPDLKAVPEWQEGLSFDRY